MLNRILRQYLVSIADFKFPEFFIRIKYIQTPIALLLDFPKTLYLSKFHFQQYVEVPVGVISEYRVF